MYTFLAYFRRWLDGQGIWHTKDLSADYDILFTNSFMVTYRHLAAAKKRLPGLRVVQRVDGSARDYGRADDADERQALANLAADLTVYQSEYSRISTRQKFRVISQDGPVIYNPVDTELFRPAGSDGDRQAAVRVCNASFSTNRLKGTWQIGELARRSPKVEFVLCGRYPDLPNLPNISHMGHLDRADLAATMRACDVFLSLAQKESCPNVVLEALASGLPILYSDSGGTPELVGDCGLPVTLDTFPERLARIISAREALAEKARSRVLARFTPDLAFGRYMEHIQRSQRRPLPSLRERTELARRGYPVGPLNLRSAYWAGRRFAGTIRRRGGSSAR
jgi:glycosyltransferase involved in cell wall biosynthesis